MKTKQAWTGKGEIPQNISLEGYKNWYEHPNTPILKEKKPDCLKSPHGKHEWEPLVIENNCKIYGSQDIVKVVYCKWCLEKREI